MPSPKRPSPPLVSAAELARMLNRSLYLSPNTTPTIQVSDVPPPIQVFGILPPIQVPGVPAPLSPQPALSTLKRSRFKVPRPKNSFMTYRMEKQHEVRANFPGLNSKDISRKVGAMWRKEPQEVKEWYRQRAAQLKIEHGRIYPGYKFSPKRKLAKRKTACNLVIAAARKAAAVAAAAAAALTGRCNTTEKDKKEDEDDDDDDDDDEDDAYGQLSFDSQDRIIEAEGYVEPFYYGGHFYDGYEADESLQTYEPSPKMKTGAVNKVYPTGDVSPFQAAVHTQCDRGGSSSELGTTDSAEFSGHSLRSSPSVAHTTITIQDLERYSNMSSFPVNYGGFADRAGPAEFINDTASGSSLAQAQATHEKYNTVRLKDSRSKLRTSPASGQATQQQQHDADDHQPIEQQESIGYLEMLVLPHWALVSQRTQRDVTPPANNDAMTADATLEGDEQDEK